MSNFCFAQMMHGSRLFGTSHRDSDIDMKSVWVPSSVEILLGDVNWTANDTDNSRANTRDDVDHEKHDLLRFLNLIAGGQPMAIEMLFVPESLHLIEPHPLWATIQNSASQIIPRMAGKFMGYIEDQAIGFGVKGERYAAACRALEMLESLGQGAGRDVASVAEYVVVAAGSKHVFIDRTKTSKDGQIMPVLRICNRAVSFGEKIGWATKMAQAVVDSYGDRARKLAASEFKDWRSLSHAVRLAGEAHELYSTGHITFPRPDADYLLAIKQAKVETAQITQVIGDLMEQVTDAVETSTLPDIADRTLLNSYVIDVYGDQVRRGNGHEDKSELEAFM